MEFHIPDMSCGHCKASITDVLNAALPDAALTFDMDDRRVKVSGDFETISSSEIIAMLDEIGFPAQAV